MSATEQESGWDAAHRIQRDRAKLGEAAAELVGWIEGIRNSHPGHGPKWVLGDWEAERLFALADKVREAYSSWTTWIVYAYREEDGEEFAFGPFESEDAALALSTDGEFCQAYNATALEVQEPRL